MWKEKKLGQPQLHPTCVPGEAVAGQFGISLALASESENVAVHLPEI
jgi:hypothetical protein